MRNPKSQINFKNKGFTIIETMISVSLFIVVTTIGMGSLLNANLVYQKSQDMRSVIDTLSHAMEDISRNARTGHTYHCFTTSLPAALDNSYGTPLSCVQGGSAVAFEDAYGVKDDNIDQWVYSIENDNDKGRLFRSNDGGVSRVQMTPDEVDLDLDASYFTVIGAERPIDGDDNQPMMTIRLSGDIVSKGVSSPFSLQTSVSQRVLDFDI